MADGKFSVLDQFRVDGDIAMVTGGAAGLGRIAALTLAEAGAHVCVTDIDHNRAGETVAEIAAAGGTADAWLLDVSDNVAICQVIADIAEQHGRIDILVNNAGGGKRTATEVTPIELWDRIIQMNQTQLFVCSREVGKLMLAQNKGRDHQSRLDHGTGWRRAVWQSVVPRGQGRRGQYDAGPGF